MQGGFDPYPNLEFIRIQRYDLLKALREGENLVELEVTDFRAAGHMLVDAVIESDERRITLMSDEGWQVTRNERPTALSVQRKQWLDPGVATSSPPSRNRLARERLASDLSPREGGDRACARSRCA